VVIFSFPKSIESTRRHYNIWPTANYIDLVDLSLRKLRRRKRSAWLWQKAINSID